MINLEELVDKEIENGYGKEDRLYTLIRPSLYIP